eukprot:scaffold7_cov378-Prasinococcus_capsulatus_cf.AAC.9
MAILYWFASQAERAYDRNEGRNAITGAVRHELALLTSGPALLTAATWRLAAVEQATSHKFQFRRAWSWRRRLHHGRGTIRRRKTKLRTWNLVPHVPHSGTRATVSGLGKEEEKSASLMQT